MSILLIPVLFMPIVSILILVYFKRQYDQAVDPEEKKTIKKKVTIALIINIIIFVLLAMLIALFVLWIFALGNMT